MKKLINTKYPQNIIIVDDAYVNGRRIVCSAGNDDFDVWKSCWKIEDFQPSEDLEREAVSYCYDNGINLSPKVATDFARHFIQWQMEQMMKDAISCEVIREKRDLRLIDSTERCLFDVERGDWLKIIIVKED